MKFKTIIDYELTPEDIKDCGFPEICELLKCEEGDLLTLDTDSVANDKEMNKLSSLYSAIQKEGKELKRAVYSYLYLYQNIKVVISYYEGGLYCVSFHKDSLPRILKRVRQIA